MALLTKHWDEVQKRTAIKIVGLIVAVFAIFTLVSIVSYFFTWKEDQSLLFTPSMMDSDIPVSNAGAKLGFKWAHLLVTELFGFGSLAFVVILIAISARLLFGRWKYSLLKTVVVAFFGAFIVSLILAYFSDFGGECGAYVIAWSKNMIGPVLTPVCIAALSLIWLFLSSRKFAEFVTKDRPKKEKVEKEPKPEKVRKRRKEKEAVEEEETGSPVTEVAGIDEPVVTNETIPAEGSDLEVVRKDDLSVDVTKPLPVIDIRQEEVPGFKFPSLDLLDSYAGSKREVSSEELVRNNNKIRASLANYKIQVSDVKAVVGPTFTLYKVTPARGVKISEIKRLQEDIAMSLNARGVRIVTLSDSVGIEVANDNPSIVPLKALLNDNAFRETKAELPVAIGYTVSQKVKVFDLADTPHLLIAGATKQGKSVGLNVIVLSLLYSKHPSEMKLVFIDPKMVEFSSYAQLLKHYLAVLPTAADEKDEKLSAIVKTPKDADKILKSLCIEMDERYELMSKAYVNNVKLYNEKYKERHLLPTEGHKYMPYIVTIIDEYADLTMSTGGSPETKALSRSIQGSIIRLAQKGRAAGIHVILATQRPSVDVISGIIKANFPTRIAFRVTSRVDSTTILDNPGAEKLIGKGDMIYYSGVEMERVQCGYVDPKEINAITAFIGDQQGFRKSYNTPYYLPDPAPAEGEGGGGMVDVSNLDERFVEAAKLVVTSQRASTSDLQRKLGMGYPKAGSVMDQLEAAGIVGPQEGSKPRQVLVSDLNELETILKAFVK